MMIRLNLLDEERAKQKARERDPVRIAISVCVIVVILVAAVGVVLGMRSSSEKAQAEVKKYSLAQKEKEQKEKQLDLDEMALLAKQQATADTIRRKRFLYAPQLQAVKDSIPGDVQLLKLTFGLVPVKIRNPDLDDPKRIAAAQAKGIALPPEVERKRMGLTLEGLLTGEKPQHSVEEFVALLNSASTTGRSNIPLAALLEKAELKSYKIQQAKVERVDPTAPPAPEVGRFEIVCRYRN